MSEKIRMICGATTGLAGVVVGIAMQVAGGSLARFLPEGPWFYVVAAVGAGCAGVALADAFGRRGAWGAALALVAAPIVTLIGAGLAAGLLSVIEAGLSMANDTGLRRGALSGGPALGLLAVGDAIINSPVVAATWVLSLSGMQLVMRTQRVAASGRIT